MNIFRRHRIDQEAVKALADAKRSKEQARKDRDEAIRVAAKDEELAKELRAHNCSNNFDSWIAGLLVQR